MKVLWIAYQPIRVIWEDMGRKLSDASGGWLEGASERIISHGEIELCYCFPDRAVLDGKVKGIRYYSLNPVRDIHFKDINYYKKEDYARFTQILQAENPDIIQIYGTEKQFQRTYIMMAFDAGVIDRTVVWIQGLVSVYARCYGDGLSINQIRRKTIWELLRGTNINGIRKRFNMNGAGEKRCLKLLKYAFVRTEWDEAWCKVINPQIKTLKCNETLRSVFFDEEKWNKNTMQPHSIFISQWGTPIKGFHILLEAAKILIRQYSDLKIYTTGQNVFESLKFTDQIREESYTKIIREMIEQYGLKDRIFFLGRLSSKEMRDQYIHANVSVVSSSIENSPNSLGEAMILGVPVVAANVGGVSSMLTDKIEGLLYPFHESAMLAHYVSKIFDDDELACTLSANARKRALETHDQEKNYRNLVEGYKAILGP